MFISDIIYIGLIRCVRIYRSEVCNVGAQRNKKIIPFTSSLF